MAVSSPEGEITLWVYYPQLSSQTLPHLLLLLSKEHTAAQSDLTAAQLANDKKREAALLNLMGDIRTLEAELQQLNDLPYKPNHDDGVGNSRSVAQCIPPQRMEKECLNNWEDLQKVNTTGATWLMPSIRHASEKKRKRTGAWP